VYDISNFIENLGFALTSKNVELRVDGMKLLSRTLKALPNDFLTEKQVTFLINFYADRCKDSHNVIPAIIDGIDALIKTREFPKQCLQTIMKSFFENTTCQSQVRTDRSKLFHIFKFIIENYPDGAYETS